MKPTQHKKLEAPCGRRISQREIAEVLKIPQSTADKMLRGETRMGIHMVVRLWHHYDLGPVRAIQWADDLADRYNRRHTERGDQ
mgnify:CR=1 FL=1